MVDREELSKRHRKILRSAAFTSAVPAVLAAVAWLTVGSPRPAGLFAGTVSIQLLSIFGVIACAAPLGAFAIRRLMYRLPVVPALDGATGRPNMPAIAELSGAEYSMWTLPSLLGFVTMMRGGPWAYFFGALLVSAAGFVISFPRWSTWSAIADAYDDRQRTEQALQPDASSSVH